MVNNQAIILLYIFFIWLVVLHTFEEISQNIYETKVGRIKMSQRKYLIGASIITTINLGTLALIVSGSKIGLYMGILTSSTIGILQAPIHTYGFFREGRKTKKLGAGFYSSIPLAITGFMLLINILKEI